MTTILCFQGRAGDRNARAATGALAVAEAMAAFTGRTVETLGRPEPPLAAPWSTELEAAREGFTALTAAVRGRLDAGEAAVLALPRCAAGLATVPAVVKAHPEATIVWFDAHGDCNTPEESETGYLGGMVLTGAAGVWDTGLGAGLDLARVILVGARDLDPAERRRIATSGIRLLAVGPDLPAQLKAALAGRPAYVHLDCDVLEPGLVPTEYAVANGLTFAAFRRACAAIAEGGVVGLEVAEFEAAWPDGAPGDPAPLVEALGPLLAAVD